jgi:hypothetical protein
LVEEIENVVIAPASSDRGADFFKPDADLFERRSTPSKPTLVATSEPPVIVSPASKADQGSAPTTGAKLVIRRSTHVSDDVSPSSELVVETQSPAIELPDPPQQERSFSDNPRIVIIRRRAEDMPDVTVGTESAA